jgi:hypothetical protein
MSDDRCDCPRCQTRRARFGYIVAAATVVFYVAVIGVYVWNLIEERKQDNGDV